MSDEWGPWIEHDGKGCPLPVGTLVHRVFAKGIGYGGVVPPGSTEHISRVHPGEFGSWDHSIGHVQVIRYRLHRPTALREMIDRAESLPVVAPKRVEPAGPLEVM